MPIASIKADDLGQGKGSVVLNDPDPHYGESVTFTVDAHGAEMPWLGLQISQGGTEFSEDNVVYSQTHGMFEGYYTDPIFQLGPSAAYTGGEGFARAQLYSIDKSGHHHTIATLYFTVAA